MSRKTTKKAIKKRYIEQRKQAKEEYIKENGNTRGLKKSDLFKKIEKREKAANRRLEAKKLGGAAGKKINNDLLLFNNKDLFFITPVGDESSAIAAFREIEQSTGEAPIALTIFFDNSKSTPKRSEFGMIKDLLALTRQAAQIQLYFKKKNLSVYPQIVVKSGRVKGQWYVFVEGKDPKIKIENGEITILSLGMTPTPIKNNDEDKTT